MTDAVPLVCERCGQYHACHPESTARGGVTTLVQDAADVLCLVCLHSLVDRPRYIGEPRAQPHSPSTTADSEHDTDTDSTQRELTAYE